VDAFADKPFTGNPVAVVPLVEWLPDALMQAIAAENNLSETAFLMRQTDGRFHIRWFSPIGEIPWRPSVAQTGSSHRATIRRHEPRTRAC